MAQLNSNLGASNDVFHSVKPNNVNRSKFDLSRLTNLTCDSGMIVPFDWFETLPGDSFDLSCTVALETLPTVTNVLTPFKVRTHWYYIPYRSLWKGWQTFITKGRSGNVSLKIPQIKPNLPIVFAREKSYKQYYDTPHSLASFLGCPVCHRYTQNSDLSITYVDYLPYCEVHDDTTADIKTGFNPVSSVSALPFMAYQSICKYNYVDQNLLQDCTSLFPVEGDNDWMLPYTVGDSQHPNICTTVSGVFVGGISADSNVVSWSGYSGYHSNDTNVSLLALRYAPFERDYFVSSVPWLQRGDVQTMPFEFDDSKIWLYNTDLAEPVSGLIFKKGVLNGYNETPYTSNDNLGLHFDSSLNSSITANKLRELLAMSVWQERNSRVNGSYNSMIWIHWSHNPKAEEHFPIFIGGTSSDISFSNVIQTSQSSSDSPLGSVAGRGTMLDKSNVGRFDCDDYGIIMGCLIISPVTTYNDGVEHSLACQNVMEDFVQPEFENLSPQPILNKEIFVSGSDSVDNDLFGYQDRYSYLKSRLNVNRGLFKLKPKTSGQSDLFYSSTQSRVFNDLPKLSYQFVTQLPANVRRDWLAYYNYPMFKVQIASEVSAVRPLSYSSVPNTFGF